MLRIVN